MTHQTSPSTLNASHHHTLKLLAQFAEQDLDAFTAEQGITRPVTEPLAHLKQAAEQQQPPKDTKLVLHLIAYAIDEWPAFVDSQQIGLDEPTAEKAVGELARWAETA